MWTGLGMVHLLFIGVCPRQFDNFCKITGCTKSSNAALIDNFVKLTEGSALYCLRLYLYFEWYLFEVFNDHWLPSLSPQKSFNCNFHLFLISILEKGWEFLWFCSLLIIAWKMSSIFTSNNDPMPSAFIQMFASIHANICNRLVLCLVLCSMKCWSQIYRDICHVVIDVWINGE